MGDLPSIGIDDLAWVVGLIFALVAVVAYLKYGVAKSLMIASFRLVAQLLLVGYALTALFDNGQFGWVLGVSLVMLLVAGREVIARQKNRLSGWWGYGIGTSTMFVSSFSITLYGLTLAVGPDPWFSPRFAIPLLGMVLGNTMTGVSISMDRLTTGLVEKRALIEQKLMLGFTASEAMQDLKRDSFRSGMIPVINSMATAGIVSLPGMMTGQILGGSPPHEAVRYQILIWFLIAAGNGFGMMAAIGLASKRLFDNRERLRLDRLVKGK